MPPFAPQYPRRFLPASPPPRTRRSGGPSCHSLLPVESPPDVLGPAGGAPVEPAAGLAAPFAAFGPLPPAPPDGEAQELQKQLQELGKDPKPGRVRVCKSEPGSCSGLQCLGVCPPTPKKYIPSCLLL